MRLSNAHVSKLSIAVLLSLGLLLAVGYGERALADEGFTTASLEGTYAIAIIGQGGEAPLAGISIKTIRRDGTFMTSTILNLPGPSEERIIFPINGVGTAEVNPDGTGTATSLFFLEPGDEPGSAGTANYNFVITKARRRDHFKIAEEISFVVRQLQAAGNMNTFVATRLPEKGEFTNASIRGTYAIVSVGRGGQAPEASVGAATFDGGGNFSGRTFINQPGEDVGEREVVEVPFEGTYTVNANGTGAALPFTGGEAIFVITKARQVRGVNVATEIFLVANNLSPTTGSLVTSVATRQPR
jgi:hypothetical protein